MKWDPVRYEQFVEQRLAPGRDLIALVEMRAGLRAVDLGCGTGRLTRELADALPGSDVTGIDRSPDMLARAAEHARPGLRFELGAIEELVRSRQVEREDTFDLIYSNAAIQWLPDHRLLVTRLFERLRPGGQLVVQVPSNRDHPTTRMLQEVAESEPFRADLAGVRAPTTRVLPVHEYAEVLFAAGGTDLVACENVSPHVRPDARAMVEWQRGAALLPYLERLDEQQSTAFLDALRASYTARYPARPCLFAFRRILFSARRR
jgi:trans-aconitate 2-methyltransferase